MSTVFYRTLVSQAKSHLQDIPSLLQRVDSNFLVVNSINNAIQELQDTIKLLERAKESYQTMKS